MNMTRLFKYTGLAFLLVLGLGACKDTIDEYYTNPNKTTTGNVSQLFTRMAYHERIMPTYWDYATFVTGTTAKFSQFIGITNSPKMYQPSTSYGQDRWVSFYSGRSDNDGGIMNLYREIEKNYNALPASQQADQYVYVQLSKVLLYDQTAQIIDLWGDVPFTQAGLLNATNTLQNGEFDDAATVYKAMIDSLASLNTYFSTTTLNTTQKTSLSTQDILLKGNLSMWRKYTNSLRLRLLMRISNYDESTASTKITAMLNDEATYPLVNDNSENILLKMFPSGQKIYSEGLRAGLTDGASSNGALAPQYLLEDVMVANADPRTEVFWDKGGESSSFQGIPTALTSSAQEAMISGNLIASYDSATFIMNWNVPGVIISAAEVSFLKAEAYERWALGTAQDAYETGIRQSVEFYYSINSSAYLNPNYTFSRSPLSSPASTDVDDYIAGTAIAYSGTADEKLEKIATQKWINYFILQAGQAWAEYRRTGYPVLTFPGDPSTSELPPSRLIYPGTEVSYNAANYAKVASKDLRDTKIFWDVK
jgi:hypothetical protein